MNIVIYNEFCHEKEDESIKKLYPMGIHTAIADFLREEIACEIRCFSVEDVNEGLTDQVLAKTDVLLWWGHMAHEQVDDAVALRIKAHVLSGMGAIFLHSAHFSKPFTTLMGTSGSLAWKGDFVKERLWCINRTHPITKDIPENFVLEKEEMYSEPFDIPIPDELLFIAWYDDGHIFRSGCTYSRGNGKIFYFQPGHEEFPTYYNKNIQRVITNAVKWAAPANGKLLPTCTQLLAALD